MTTFFLPAAGCEDIGQYNSLQKLSKDYSACAAWFWASYFKPAQPN